MSASVCSLCGRQFAKYTCPTCNVPYCSLSCFRSQAHSQCSESFYKKELESDIRSSPSNSMEERRKMMELLKKFEETSNVEALNLIDDEDPSDDLAERLQNINLDAVSPDELWSLLNTRERSQFMEALRDPSGEFAQQLLSNKELVGQIPWWEESDIENDQSTTGSRPESIMVPLSLVKSAPTSSLLYNACAICLAYIFTIRRLATSSFSKLASDDPDREAARCMISKLVPFLTDKKSTTRFLSLSEAITDVWSRFDEGEMNSQTLAALLQDCASLINPLRVTYVPSQPMELNADPKFHPHHKSVLVLSDLSALFSRSSQASGSKSGKAGSDHVIQKLLFYAAHVLSSPSRTLQLAASQMKHATVSCDGCDEDWGHGNESEIRRYYWEGSWISKFGKRVPSQSSDAELVDPLNRSAGRCLTTCHTPIILQMAPALFSSSLSLLDKRDACSGGGGGAFTYTSLRIASVFIIMATSMFGALFPVLAKRSNWLRVPTPMYDFAKYFGSGVIIATAFIHLLGSALTELSSQCLSPAWQVYPYALALCLLSTFVIFIVELIAFRVGTAKLQKLGIKPAVHGHAHGQAHAPACAPRVDDGELKEDVSQHESESEITYDEDTVAQVIGIAILEFGVILHSVLVGLTLAVDPSFITLFVVIIFHQTFEGLGVGSRLAQMKLPSRHNWVPVAGGLLYGITTPIGIAVGLGIRSTYNPGSAKASIVSGVLDSMSAGILMYTGYVELLAHDFIFNKEMLYGPPKKLVFALCTMLLGLLVYYNSYSWSMTAVGDSKHKMPPGMIMGPDGKPCKICTAFRNWKPRTGSNIERSGDPRLNATAAMAAMFAAPSSSRQDEPPPGCPPDVEQLGRATWTFLHATAAYYPDKPTPTQRANMLTLLRALPVLYPCGWCAMDLDKDMQEHPPDVSGRVALSRWLCERHNVVNEKLGKEMFDCSKTDERWKDGPSDGRCD
ncbi:hypothetical protein APHAL10511_004376 [Amanita phalloides]|nr:hypothetical protein APHAL10511_004376 [Amanita phalloides]